MFAREAVRYFLAVLLAVPLHAAAQPPVRLATHDQAPYGSYIGEGPERRFDGIAVRVLTCAFKAMGRPLAIEVYPWERAQRMAEAGEVQGFFPATLRAERLVWAAASEQVAEQKWVWYWRTGTDWNPQRTDFRERAQVGAHLGSNRLKLLEQDGYQVVLKPATDAALLRAFLAGRADAILGGNLAIAEAMKQQQVDASRLQSAVAQDNPLFAYFGRAFLQQEPDFLGRFNAALPACRARS